MTNALQDQLVKELTEHERLLNDSLEQTERALMRVTRSRDEARLDTKAGRLAKELTEIDEVLRLLEAR